MDALTKAFADVERMRTSFAITAAKSPSVANVVASGQALGMVRPSVGIASEQLAHFKGWVWSAVRLIATRVAGQSIFVAKKPTTPKRGKQLGEALEPLETHSLLDALADPSELHTEWSLKFVTVASLELTGRALWWVTQDNGRQVVLHIPTSWIVSVDARRTVWNIRPNGSTQEFPLPGDEVVHFFYPDPADPLGAISPLSRIGEAVLTDEAISTAQFAAFRNGIFPKVILTAGRLPDSDGIKGERPCLTSEQRQDLIGAIKGVYQGSLKADEPFIIDGLIEDITKLSNTIAEMDFLNSGKLTKSKVLQGFGVSPILLGEVEGANRASATVADEIFCAAKINPLIELLSQSMTAWLGPMFAKPREKLVVWIDPAIAHDPELDLKRWELAGQMGWVSGNEYRRRVLNLKDVDGGDEFLTPAMMLPKPAGQRSLILDRSTDPYSLRPLNNGSTN